MKKNTENIKNANMEEDLKEIGIFEDFAIIEKEKVKKENKDSNDLSFLNDWIFLENPFSEKALLNKSKKSRFSDLFKEIQEEENKTKKEEQIFKKDDTLKKNISISSGSVHTNFDSVNTNFDSKIFGSMISINDSLLEKSNNNIIIQNSINKSNNNIIIDNSINNNIINNNNINNNNNKINDENNENNINSNNNVSNKNNINTDNNNKIIENNKNENKKLETEEKVEEIDLHLDINKVISLEDKRTTVMIKNIPNKFNKDLLLSIFNQHFKGTYNIFVLPTDINKYKNFGYSFINFTSSYFIPYFYFMFNGKMWNSTNSKKVCELTYSKVQGKENLLQHYPTKILYTIDDAYEIKPEQKYIIPNVYKIIFNKYFPDEKIQEFKFYFITKMPGQN